MCKICCIVVVTYQSSLRHLEYTYMKSGLDVIKLSGTEADLVVTWDYRVTSYPVCRWHTGTAISPALSALHSRLGCVYSSSNIKSCAPPICACVQYCLDKWCLPNWFEKEITIFSSSSQKGLASRGRSQELRLREAKSCLGEDAFLICLHKWSSPQTQDVAP